MNREFKFRGWHKDGENVKSYMVYSDECESEGVKGWELSTFFEHCPMDSFIIDQYIGIKDKDGQEIYEGDILEYSSVSKEMGYVIYDKENCKFVLQCGEREMYQQFSLSNYYINKYSKVIGNIHENPELIKVP